MDIVFSFLFQLDIDFKQSRTDKFFVKNQKFT